MTNWIEVRHASGEESYLTFAGETEHPAPHEVVFADGAGRAHARQWTNRQSGYSAVQESTASVLIVAEAMHETAADDMGRLVDTIGEEVARTWSATPAGTILTRSDPQFVF